MRTIFIFLCLCSSVFAQELIADRETRLDGVISNTLLTKTQAIAQKENLKGLISVRLEPAKNDYVDDYNRGTVKYSEKEGNYSYQKVIIPEGTNVTGKNFSQKNPHTESISGKNLKFVSCNLANVELDTSWIVEDSLTIQIKYEEVTEKDKTFNVRYLEKNGVWEEQEREEISSVSISK